MNNSNNGTIQDILNSIGPASVNALNSVGATPQGATGDSGQAVMQALMAKSAEKALKNNLDTHAQTLLDTHPDGANILATVLATHQAMNPEVSTNTSGGAQTSNSDIQQQAQQIITPEHRTLLGNILNTLGNVTGINAMNAITEQGTKSMKLSNLDAAQKIMGQQPIQPLEAENMDRETLKNSIDATTAQLTNSTTAYKNIVDSMKEEKAYRNPLETLSGSPNQTYKDKRADLELQHQNYLTNHKNLTTLLDAQQKQQKLSPSNKNQDKIIAQVGKYGLVGK